MDKFQEKIPKFSGKKIAFFGVYVLFILSCSLMTLFFLDNLPLLLNSEGLLGMISPWFPVIGVISVEIVGIILTYQMWFWRERLKAKYGQLSYQKVFLAGFAGILILISISFQMFIPFDAINSQFWSNGVFALFTKTFTSYFLPISLILDVIRIIIGILVCILAILMMVRSLSTFGFDYMTVIYLYFPEESSLQEHEIYSVIRHPMYSGLIILCAGGFILQFNLYHALFFIIYYLGFSFHIFFIEEKELIKRFGDSYIEYRKKVPAIFPYPTKLKIFFRFIFGKSN